MGLAAAADVAALQGAPSPNYDEQLGTTFTQAFSSLAYNVTALAQADADGYGPGYLLNGLTPEGYWYQVGVSYHWPNSDGSYEPGFGFSYQVYGSSGKSVYPSKGAGLDAFSGVVNSGDSVLLSLTFTGSSVLMRAQDWNTGAAAETSYNSEGASAFVGDAFAPVDSNGFFTGLMTEWYHTAAYFANEGQVTYTNGAVALNSAWMWIDEFDSSTTAPALFDNQTQAPVTFANDHQVYPFAAGGATMYISAHEFVTGLAGTSSRLTLTPATTEASSPSFSANYTLAGQPQTAVIAPGANVLEADLGTSITVSINSSGSSALERWVFNGTAGTEVSFAAGTNASYAYYHVVQETVSYQVAGGGQALPDSSKLELTYEAPPGVPSPTPAAITQPLGTTPVVIYAVVGTAASIGTVPGAAGERWAANTQNWTVSTPNSLPEPIQLYQQYDVSVSYSIVGGGTPPEVPEFNSTAFGVPAVILLSNNSTTGWFDAGSDYSFTNALNGTTSTERWLYFGNLSPSPCENPLTQCVNAPNQEISAAYTHQYYVDLAVNDVSGGGISGNYSRTYPGVGRVIMGSVPLGPAWMDAGGNLSLTARATDRWQFETWVGSGVGAYGGVNPSIEVTVTGPLSENATFYPQLAISADGGTDIAYSFGSSTGTVQAGTTKTLYVPPSTNVTLRATPSLFVYSFASWRGTGVAKATKPSLSLVVDSPSAVTGTSSFSYAVVLGVAIVAAIVIILAVSLLVRSRRRRAEIYGFSPSYP